MLYRVIDIETTGLAPPSEIIEFGYVDVSVSETGTEIGRPVAVLFRPLKGIPPETMAVHHLTEDDFDEHTSACTDDALAGLVWGTRVPDALVAHNCDFERTFISPAVTKNLPWVCTHKAALRLWPNAPRCHSACNIDPVSRGIGVQN